MSLQHQAKFDALIVAKRGATFDTAENPTFRRVLSSNRRTLRSTSSLTSKTNAFRVP